MSSLPARGSMSCSQSATVVPLGDALAVVLGEVADLRLVAPGDGAGVGVRARPTSILQSVVLPDAVAADDGDLLAAHDERVEVVAHRHAGPALGEALDQQRLLAARGASARSG